jgi:hypothetical protein
MLVIARALYSDPCHGSQYAAREVQFAKEVSSIQKRRGTLASSKIILKI